MRHFSVPITWHCFPLNLVITTACALKKKKKSLCQARPQLLYKRKQKPSSPKALCPKISALGRIIEMIYVRVKGELLMTLDGVTSRELGMPELGPDNLLRMYEIKVYMPGSPAEQESVIIS